MGPALFARQDVSHDVNLSGLQVRQSTKYLFADKIAEIIQLFRDSFASSRILSKSNLHLFE